MSKMAIRPGSLSDLEQLNELMYQLHHEHHLSCPEHFKTAEEIEQEKSIARYLEHPECVVYVAEEKGQIAGFITGQFCELSSAVSKPVMMGSVDELYVLPDFRHRGLATALFERVEKTFREYGIRQLFVEVWDFNQGAQQFYFQHGFSHHIHWLRKAIGDA